MGYIGHVCKMFQKPSTNSNFGNQTHTNDNHNKIAKKTYPRLKCFTSLSLNFSQNDVPLRRILKP